MLLKLVTYFQGDRAIGDPCTVLLNSNKSLPSIFQNTSSPSPLLQQRLRGKIPFIFKTLQSLFLKWKFLFPLNSKSFMGFCEGRSSWNSGMHLKCPWCLSASLIGCWPPNILLFFVGCNLSFLAGFIRSWGRCLGPKRDWFV